jgi:hypothetical protein
MVNFTLPDTEQLSAYVTPYPLKDAKGVWDTLSHMRPYDLMGLIPCLIKPEALIKPGRPNQSEALARTILFDMSEAQRETAYKIILRKAESISMFQVKSEPEPETKSLSIYEAVKNMTKEELAEWLYANCEYISAEYGACSGSNDSSDILRLLDKDIAGDW